MLIGEFQRARVFVKSIAVTVTVAFLALCLQPLAMAANGSRVANSTHRTIVEKPRSDEEQLSDTIGEIQRTLSGLDTALAKQADTRSEDTRLESLNRKLGDLDSGAMARFAQIDRLLRTRKVPSVILERQRDAVRTYKREMAKLREGIETIVRTQDAGKRHDQVRRLTSYLHKKHMRHVVPSDGGKLPNRALRPETNNRPKEHVSDFRASGLFNNPLTQIAANGSFVFDQLAGADNPAYLAQTTEVKFSPAIQAKAAELNHNPVKIYNWVRNNIQWQPTWGAIQDADLTLATERGNDFDIASLLIALLRVSGIPARYVHGTMDVPTEQFQNWAGGFEDPVAASNFAASGGIPITNIVSGGRIQSHRLEHVWVEAAIDFIPSRGAVNRSADSWVAMDASYKQYQYLKALDPLTATSVDPQELAQRFTQSGTINDAEGWVSGLDPTILQNAQTQMQTDLQNYIDNNLPDATVGDVIGGRRIVAESAPVLPASLPYNVVTVGARYAKVPAALEHQVAFAFGTDALGDLVDPVTYPWPALNSHKVTLSFQPATDADKQALMALLPDGQVTDASQLPSSIPAYLIRVVPQLAVDGTVVKTGDPMTLGEELPLTYRVTMPGRDPTTHQSSVIAGSYFSIAVVGGSVSTQALTRLKGKLASTKTTLESGDDTLIGALTREDILGNMFYAGTLGYFAQYAALSHVAALRQDARFILAPSMGTYGYEPHVSYFFGIPRSLEPGGVAMNMDRVYRILGTTQSDPGKVKGLNLQVGILSSSLESAIPEQMFTSDPQHPVNAVSAVKALALANAQGQRIYDITQANEASALPNIHQRPETMAEIQAALANGKEVITHTDPISVPGWTGAGYIIFDPITGDGAYKIGGDMNGGFAAGILGFSAVGLMSTLLLTPVASLLVGTIALVLFFISLGLLTSLLLTYSNSAGFWPCFLTGIGVAGVIAGGAEPKQDIQFLFWIIGYVTGVASLAVSADCLP